MRYYAYLPTRSDRTKTGLVIISGSAWRACVSLHKGYASTVYSVLFTNKQKVSLANKQDHYQTKYIHNKLNGLPTKKENLLITKWVVSKYLSTFLNKQG